MIIMLTSLLNAVLEELEFNGPQTPVELAAKLYQPAAFIRSALAELGEQGLVEGEPGPRSKRVQVVRHG